MRMMASVSSVYRAYIIRSDWTGIMVMPVTVTTTVTVKALRRSSNLMIWRYCGGREYIMSNEF